MATLQEIVINNNFLKKDIFFYYIYYILGCRITFLHCLYPDCQHMPILSFFQKFNGKSFEIDANNLTYSRGVSPFSKDYCTACKAPLSPKAVEHMYSQIADE